MVFTILYRTDIHSCFTHWQIMTCNRGIWMWWTKQSKAKVKLCTAHNNKMWFPYDSWCIKNQEKLKKFVFCSRFKTVIVRTLCQICLSHLVGRLLRWWFMITGFGIFVLSMLLIILLQRFQQSSSECPFFSQYERFFEALGFFRTVRQDVSNQALILIFSLY